MANILIIFIYYIRRCVTQTVLVGIAIAAIELGYCIRYILAWAIANLAFMVSGPPDIMLFSHILTITLYAARGCNTAHPIHHILMRGLWSSLLIVGITP